MVAGFGACGAGGLACDAVAGFYDAVEEMDGDCGAVCVNRAAGAAAGEAESG